MEPWYVAYALMGATTGGLAPILLPLEVSRASSVASVGFVLGAIGVGGLTAAAWGYLADRWRCHRALFAGGALGAAAALAVIPLIASPPLWVALTLALGTGTAMANTVANLFITEVRPEEEWDARIGWLQAFYNAGVVAGLLAAGGLTRLPPEVGLWVAAGLTLAAAGLGWALTPTSLRGAAPARPRPIVALYPGHVHHPPGRLLHYLTPASLVRLARTLRSPFGVFLAIWVLGSLGPSAVYALYPLLMREVFGIPPDVGAFAMAASMALGTLWYAPVGGWVHRAGALRVLDVGLALRLGSLLALLVLGLTTLDARAALAIVAYLVMDQAWVLMIVSGTVLTSRLTTIGQGDGMGAFNSAAALATLLGTSLSGWVADRAGYDAVWAVGVAALVAAAVLAATLPAAPGIHDEPASAAR